MKITLTDAGKRFNREWIFRHVNYRFTNGNSYAITGPNGSGKSTFLQLIAGSLIPSEGNIVYDRKDSLLALPSGEETEKGIPAGSAAGESLRHTTDRQGAGSIAPDRIYLFLSMAAPYLELVEELTLIELLRFHGHFKPLIPGMDAEKLIGLIGLEKSARKQIRYYSSGMKQRVKLALAVFSDAELLLLDEPCTNLDAEGIALYRRLIRDFCGDRLVIVSSNDLQEYEFCEERIEISAYR